MIYRVKEYQGRFYIQGKFKHIETECSFWRALFGIQQKQIDKGFAWFPVNDKGSRCINYYRIGLYDTPCESFSSLAAACEKINLFNDTPKYHYPDGKPPEPSPLEGIKPANFQEAP